MSTASARDDSANEHAANHGNLLFVTKLAHTMSGMQSQHVGSEATSSSDTRRQ